MSDGLYVQSHEEAMMIIMYTLFYDDASFYKRGAGLSSLWRSLDCLFFGLFIVIIYAVSPLVPTSTFWWSNPINT